MATPAPTRLTYRDLEEILPEGSLYTLDHGELIMTPAPNLEHQSIVLRIAFAIQRALSDASRVFVAPTDVVFSEDEAAQPDVVLVLERNRAVLKRVIQGVPDLVVEVLSPATAKRDKTVKKTMYERNRVPEYWIVSPENRTIEVYRLDAAASAYGLISTSRPADVLTTPLLPSLSIDVGQIFTDV